MKVLILFPAGSPDERQAEQFAKRLEELRTPAELIESDSREGIAARASYDLTAAVAVVVTRDDGTMVERWQGDWPLAEDISYNFHS